MSTSVSNGWSQVSKAWTYYSKKLQRQHYSDDMKGDERWSYDVEVNYWFSMGRLKLKF
jgi:hypothetical protein